MHDTKSNIITTNADALSWETLLCFLECQANPTEETLLWVDAEEFSMGLIFANVAHTLMHMFKLLC